MSKKTAGEAFGASITHGYRPVETNGRTLGAMLAGEALEKARSRAPGHGDRERKVRREGDPAMRPGPLVSPTISC